MRPTGKAAPAVIAFAARLGSDQTLRKRIDGLRVGDKTQTLSDIVWLASEAGFFFSAEELETGWRAMVSDQLSESELDAVAGGVQSFDQQQSYQSFQSGVSVLTGIMKQTSDSQKQVLDNMKK